MIKDVTFPRYGLSLPNRGILFGATSVDELLEVSERAEASGAFESIWVGDSLFSKPRPDSLALLGAVMFMTINLAVDLLYGYLDPRIRYST